MYVSVYGCVRVCEYIYSFIYNIFISMFIYICIVCATKHMRLLLQGTEIVYARRIIVQPAIFSFFPVILCCAHTQSPRTYCSSLWTFNTLTARNCNFLSHYSSIHSNLFFYINRNIKFISKNGARSYQSLLDTYEGPFKMGK